MRENERMIVKDSEQIQKEENDGNRIGKNVQTRQDMIIDMKTRNMRDHCNEGLLWTQISNY